MRNKLACIQKLEHIQVRTKQNLNRVLNYLKLVINLDNLWAFKRVVNEPKRGIGTTTIEKIDELVESGFSLNKVKYFLI